MDAVVVDGKGWASYFYRQGYWSWRPTVVLGWDLDARKPIERSPDFEVRQEHHPDPETVARFILNSYQPYFRWWKEPREDQKWLRVELQPEDLEDQFNRASAGIRRQVIEDVAAPGRTARRPTSWPTGTATWSDSATPATRPRARTPSSGASWSRASTAGASSAPPSTTTPWSGCTLGGARRPSTRPRPAWTTTTP